MFETFEECSAYIKKHNILNVDLKFVDLFGRWHHLTVPASGFKKSVLKNGVGFDSSNFPGFKSLESGDMIIIPVLNTSFVDPFWESPTLSFLCNIAEADTGENFARDPRTIAARAESYLCSTGIADASMWAPEFEYYIFDSVKFRNDTQIAYYEMASSEAFFYVPDSTVREKGHRIPRKGGYHIIPPQDQFYDLRASTCKLLEDAGIRVHYHHHEVGGPGQSEIEVPLDNLTRMGDHAMVIKYFIKMLADRHGRTATFMPKPLYREAGNGMHFHQYLMKNGRSIFYDESGYAGLSKIALNYIAGILRHGPALLALTNPSTNSYKRLVPGYEAPVHLFFSMANRSAAIRIPKYVKPEEHRIEFRPPDATCNIYLAMAAMLMAGLDGIEKALMPEDENYGPFDVNIFEMDENERRKIKALPDSLDNALKHLARDHEFLLKGNVFTKEFIEDWIANKLEHEYLAVLNRPHPYEIELYLDT